MIKQKELHLYENDRKTKKVYAVIEIDCERIKADLGLDYTQNDNSNEEMASDYLEFIDWKLWQMQNNSKGMNRQAETALNDCRSVFNAVKICTGCEY